MRISFSAPSAKLTGAVAVAVMEGGTLCATATKLDEATDGALSRAVETSPRFTGKKGQILEILAPVGLQVSRVLLFGIGKPADYGELDQENNGGELFARIAATGEANAIFCLDALEGATADPQRRAARMAFGALLRSYRFDKYRTKEKADSKPSLKSLTVMVPKPAQARAAFAEAESIAEGVFTARDVISEPANVIYPQSFVAEAKKLEKLGVKIDVLGEKEMQKLGMGALLGVGQGSVRESRLLLMRWDGARKSGKGKAKAAQPIAIVGKGVTFDTGGISIKPAAGMEDMKWDMGGAGVVLGLMKALAGRKAKVNAVGVCGLVENMPDGNAQRPGDIVTSMSGQTIEVLNTDAEGRLVLADALWYTQKTYKPRAIIDLATLTGAIIVALGKVNAGLFSNNDELAERLAVAGKAVGEPVWRMPLGEDYDKQIDSDAADMKNIGNRWGGSITAAQFLQRFIQDGTAWAHLDIAGVTWTDKDKPTVRKGASAFGVRLLDRLVAQHYEG
jgi:leucyl aminopeptidase